MKRAVICLWLVFMFWAFDMGDKMEEAWLQIRKNTLKSELEKSRETIHAVIEIGKVIDSIDMNRNELVVMLEENKSFRNYGARLQAINDYIVNTQTRMECLDEEISLLNNQAPGFSETILGLKKKLERRNRELDNLKKQFIQYQEENNNLFKNVNLQEAELANHQDQLEMKDDELKSLEAKIQEAWERKRVTEGEALYGQAHAVEEKAYRTHFAPDKKRQALMEALDLYRQSFVLGNEEARPKLLELLKKLGYAQVELHEISQPERQH